MKRNLHYHAAYDMLYRFYIGDLKFFADEVVTSLTIYGGKQNSVGEN